MPSPGDGVQALQQVVRRQLDLLVTPLRGAIDARDQGRPMDPTEIAADEGVAGLGLVARALRETEVPRGVLIPGVPLQVGILSLRARLHLAPVAVQDVLPAVDQALDVLNRCLVDGVRRHPTQTVTDRGQGDEWPSSTP